MQDQPEALDDLLPDRRRGRPRRPRRLRRADEEHRHRRHGERHRIDQDRERGAHHLDQRAREPRAADLGERRARRELAVAVDDAIDADQRRDVGGIGRIEQRAQAPLQEDDDIELLHPQDTRGVRDRDREQEQRPQRVRADQERPAPEPVDPGPREQPDEEDGQAAGDHQERHVRRAGAEDEQRHERDRRAGHDRAQLGDRLTRPQLQEVGVSPE